MSYKIDPTNMPEDFKPENQRLNMLMRQLENVNVQITQTEMAMAWLLELRDMITRTIKDEVSLYEQGSNPRQGQTGEQPNDYDEAAEQTGREYTDSRKSDSPRK